MSKSKKTEEIIEEFKNIHGDKYDYSLVEYKSAHTKVKIICKEHYVFEQLPNNHKKGHGCKLCSGNVKLTTEQFIERSKQVHGDRYEYKETVYKNKREKITITCKIHGNFNQRPDHYLNGVGCTYCSSNLKLDNDVFINKSRGLHGDRYDYRLVNYKNNKTKVKIVCREHGPFSQLPGNHLSGHNCEKCSIKTRGRKRTKNSLEFIKESNIVHINKYDYSLVKYKDNRTKVVIKCPVHNTFKQSPYNHLLGQGCPECAQESRDIKNRLHPRGWNVTSWERSSLKSKSFDSFKVYVIKCYGNCEEFYKIGRTYKKVKNRFGGKKAMPYNYEVIKELIFDNAKDAYNKETELKRLNKKHSYVPKINFGGQYECFTSISSLAHHLS